MNEHDSTTKPPRHLKRMAFLAACSAMVLLLSSAAFAQAPGAAATLMNVGGWSGTEEPLTVLSEEQHPNGLVVTEFSNGVRVAGPPGTTVSLDETEDENGGSGELSMKTPPAPGPTATSAAAGSSTTPGYTTRDAAEALGLDAEAMEELGLNDCEWMLESVCEGQAPATAAAGAGSAFQPVPPTPSPEATMCAETGAERDDGSTDNAQVYAYGCGNRYAAGTTPTSFYKGYTSQVSGKSKSIHMLTGLATRHDYVDGQVVSWSPADEKPVGACETVTWGVAEHGVSLSTSSQVCPSKIRPTITPQVYYVDWEGREFRDITRAAEGVNIVETPNGLVDGHEYSIGWSWSY